MCFSDTWSCLATKAKRFSVLALTFEEIIFWWTLELSRMLLVLDISIDDVLKLLLGDSRGSIFVSGGCNHDCTVNGFKCLLFKLLDTLVGIDDDLVAINLRHKLNTVRLLTLLLLSRVLVQGLVAQRRRRRR